MMKSLEGSLKRLRTDYLDVYFNHSVNEVERMQNPEWHAFTERAKRDGKIRFRGMSGHGGHLVECLDYVVDNDLADVILVAYNFAQDPSFTDRLRHTFHWSAIQPDLPRVLEKAKRKDIGVIAMKTLMGGRLNDMRPYEKSGGTFSQAAFRWVLSNKNVDALVVSMTERNEIDEFVAASGDPGTRSGDLELLERYAELQSGNYCRPACNLCEQSCPRGVPIAEVLRSRMYEVDYLDPALARFEYGALERDATACLSCASQACLGSCPSGLPIAQFTREAAVRLG
jgi:predicted aldo/keto reductase-like oxidoreductase